MSPRPAAVLLAALLAAPAPAQVTLIGVGTLPGTSTDLSGLTDKLDDGTPHNRLGGLGSAIAYAGTGDRYVLASDRGPKDGTVPFRDRMHTMTITVRPGASPAVEPKLSGTALFTNEDGKPFLGSITARPGRNSAGRLDPEGVRVGRTGTVFISDEYGPYVYEFAPDGKRVRTLAVPERFGIANPGTTGDDEFPPGNTSGRQPNRGMEGLAITPDGSKLVGLMQGPLIQDGALNGKNKRVGVNVRILFLDVTTGKPDKELVYKLDDPAFGLSEIVAVNATDFLVIERDGKAGAETRAKKVYRVATAGATDVSGIDALPGGKLPAEITPVTKTLFFDLLDPKFGLEKGEIPEKIEGLAFGPDLPDGRHLLLMTSDNDFVADKPFRVFAFGVPAADLPGYEPQQFAAAAAPGAAAGPVSPTQDAPAAVPVSPPLDAPAAVPVADDFVDVPVSSPAPAVCPPSGRRHFRRR